VLYLQRPSSKNILYYNGSPSIKRFKLQRQITILIYSLKESMEEYIMNAAKWQTQNIKATRTWLLPLKGAKMAKARAHFPLHNCDCSLCQ
jgi:hypothetical protein